MAARKIFLLCAIFVGGFAFAACGSDSDSETPTETASGATTEAVEQADPLANVRSALEANGYSVETDTPSDADAGLTVNNNIYITYYADPAQAQSVRKEISGIFKQRPGRGIVVGVGNLVIDMGEERTLKFSEVGKFNRVAAIALKAEQ